MALREIKVSVSKGKGIDIEGKIHSSMDSYKIFKELFDKDTFLWQEEMILLCLSRNNDILGYYKISKGGTSVTVCDPKVVFTVALNCVGTSAIIMAHNHPSGKLEPSQADIPLTKKIGKAGEMMGITLLDHLILAEDSYTSFADQNMM